MTTVRSSPPEQPRQPLARLVELAVVVPVEVGSRLIEAVPAVVDKVPAAAERVRREIVLARFLGKMVVDQGVRELRTRLDPVEPAPSDPVANRRTSESSSSVGTSAAAPTGERAASEVPDVTTLALVDYDHLSSAQIVGKLDDLDQNERDAIERYEIAGRHRRTILGKLDQLRSVPA